MGPKTRNTVSIIQMDKARNMRILPLSVLFVLIATCSSLDGQSLNKVLEVGEASFSERDYVSAYQCYGTLLRYPEGKYDAEEIYVKYRLALSAQRFNYFEFADSMYGEVLLMEDTENDHLKALSTFHRGEVLYSMGTDEIESPVIDHPAQAIDSLPSDTAYSRALVYFTTFLDNELYNLIEGSQEEKDRFEQRAEFYKDECVLALQEGRTISNGRVRRIVDPRINSPYSDLNPILIGDQLYFSSLRHLPKPGKARKQSRTYSRVHRAIVPGANPLDTNLISGLMEENDIFNINEDVHTVHTAINSDQTVMYFSSCKQIEGEIICHLYQRQSLGGGQWGMPQKLPINMEGDTYTTTQPSVSLDCSTGKEWLYFASDRPGSVGGLDIWRSEIMENGTLGTPLRLPEGAVNTTWNEATPFFHSSSNRLFFSSDAPPGLGMYDIFSCVFNQDGTTGARQNLGLPVNSGYNDQYYFLTPDGSRAFFSTDRPRSMRFIEDLNACCQDIYTQVIDTEMEVDIELFTCVDNDCKAPIAEAVVKVFEQDCESKTEIEGSPFTYNGQALDFEAKRYKFYSIESILPDGQSIKKDIDLAEVRYEHSSTANVEIAFFPELLDYSFIVSAPGETNGTLEYNFWLKKGDTIINQDTIKPVHQFQLTEGKYTAMVTNAYAFPEIGDKKRPLEFDTLIYTFAVLPDDERRKSCTCKIEEKLLLEVKPPSLGFPIVFYFDNDKPNRLDHDNNPNTKGLADRAGQSYDQAYEAYIDSSRVREYIDFNKENAEGIAVFIEENEVNPNPGQAAAIRANPILGQTIAEATLTAFFDNEVKAQFQNFNNFMDALIDYLNQPGNELVIEIQGYCSPLGGEAYNKLLAKRRIECIRKYMTSYRDGALEPFIDKELKIQENNIGVTQLFTDTPGRGKAAVFDYRALRARKVEIKNVTGDRQEVSQGTN
jgi:outer membrane protein OmpA-like peptidoglycan-associated protein